jgi:hypothetical protein
MGNKPILFSAPMVRAILEGRKTQTRRILKPQPQSVGEKIDAVFKYRVGDRLWVREAWGLNHTEYIGTIPKARPADLKSYHLSYLATEDDSEIMAELPFRPCIHMPRWASRITLLVEAVKVQRLQDITFNDLEAEGIVPLGECLSTDQAIVAFRDLWNSLNGPGSWDANPWVVAVKFQPVFQNIDALNSTARFDAPSTGNCGGYDG